MSNVSVINGTTHKVHFTEGQIHTTHHDRNEIVLAIAEQGEGAEQMLRNVSIEKMVMAANAHDELVAALQDLLDGEASGITKFDVLGKAHRAAARAVLAKIR
jgi:hypothetical protein